MKFTSKEYEFLKNEYGYERDQVDSFSDDELLKIGDECFDIEVEETVKAYNEALSERGETAAGLVTKINE